MCGLSPDHQSAYGLIGNRGVTVVDINSGGVTYLAKDKKFPTAGAFSPTAAVGAIRIMLVGAP